MFDFAYFANSLYNGRTVAIDNSQGTSPLGYSVHLQSRYVSLSPTITTGMYDLDNTQYPYFQRQSNTGYVIPSENEWVKAACFSPLPNGAGNGTDYFYYTTATNKAPTPLTTSGPHPTVDSLGNIITANLSPGTEYSDTNAKVHWQPPYDTQRRDREANFVNVGEDRSPSPWLTYDQGGNVVEYTDTTTTTTRAPNPKNGP